MQAGNPVRRLKLLSRVNLTYVRLARSRYEASM